jgi:hypothetical protein
MLKAPVCSRVLYSDVMLIMVDLLIMCDGDGNKVATASTSGPNESRFIMMV